ncbi:YlaC family protein [Superficieibacter sp. HKU1]|uniref:YlaC family protein n=1 Tax=Superficieibacter sp. HKU1 TaxID=3031919 RepID=UPI0023E30712|nr:YlaC family protein [Superficieibacter sp. HKU1]WES69593.1 YlaC family protein [Superficieibacter sp. HKU1]
MTEIQRLLTTTIDELNAREKRDNRPRFSISFIRNHPGLFVGMYIAWFATLVVMLRSETLADSVWLLVVLFILFNAFFFFDVNPRYRYEDIDVLDFRVCFNGEWYNTRFAPEQLIANILQSPRVEQPYKMQLQKMIATKGDLSFYDIFTLARAEASQSTG